MLVGPGPAYAARRGAQTPLTVTIDGLTPSAIAPKAGGTVMVSGSVTNTSQDPWLDVTVYPFISATPMTTTTELAEAARTDETVEVGGRLTSEGDYSHLGDLAPGQTVSYTLVIPREDLGATEPGVYWFGVHALGSGPEGADRLADGRARTFLPMLSRDRQPVRAAVIVPLRAHVVRTPDGAVAALDAWERMLSPRGRLGHARAAATSAGGDTLSWLVDPGVLDAMRQLADGNPPRNIAPTEKPGNGATTSPSPSAGPSPSASATATPKPDQRTEDVAALASSWLDVMLPVLRRSEVLALPYGDIDLSGAAAHARDVYETARTRSIAFFEGLGIPATQVNAPPVGVVSRDALTLGDTATPMVLSSAALPDELGWGRESAPAVVEADGRTVVVSSAEAASGGPGPGEPQADVPLRQRVLAEAAVRALDPARPPLVVTMPQRWNPTDPVGFVAGLDQPWLDLVGVSAATVGAVAPEVDGGALRYPASAAREELPADRFASAESLIRTGRTLQRVLSRNDTVAAEVVDEALTDVGYFARDASDGQPSDPSAASRGWILAQLGQIRVEGPSAVTLSGASGRFAATLVNGLDQPVSVVIRPDTDPGIRIRAPKSVQVAARSRMTVLLNAADARAGVHNVTLRVEDSEGTRLGSFASVPIRAAQVSNIIWLFLGVGGALLFGAIAVRLVRRIRASRAPGVTGGDPPVQRAEGRSEGQVRAGE